MSKFISRKRKYFKEPRPNFSNLISHHHQLERSSKKDSPFVVLSEQSHEGSISSNSDMKLKNQSVSSANSDLDNDGNHNGGGYLCDCSLIIAWGKH
jgi:hypothetical protein